MKIIKRLLFFYVTLVVVIGLSSAIQEGTTLSVVAARYIDKVLPSKKMDFSERMVRGFKARCVSLFAYPIYAGLDIVYLLPKAAGEFALSLFLEQPMKIDYQEAARADFTLARRSFIGFVSPPASLISADFVTRHFLTGERMDEMIKSGGSLYSTPGFIFSPHTIEEIKQLVKYASNHDRQVSVIGSGMSQGMQFLPNDSGDFVFSLRHLNNVKVYPKERVAVVEAGATWAEVQKAINPYGLAVKVMQASNIFTVGGSVSVNCHGWDHRHGTLGETIRSIKIVNADGEIQSVNPSDREFGLILGGYGLCGIVVEVELELTDNHMLVDLGQEVPINDYVDYFYHTVLSDPAIEMHLFRLSLEPGALLSEGVAQNYIRDTSYNQNVASDLIDENQNGRRIERVGIHSARKFATFRKAYWKREKQNILTPLSLSRNEVMRAPINAMLNQSSHDQEWLQEFYLPKEGLSGFLKELGKLLVNYNVTLVNASVRFVKQDPYTFLGYASEGDRFAVVLCFNQDLSSREVDHTREWIKRAVDLVLKYKGTYYLPYHHFMDGKQFRQAYPNFDEFVRNKSELDPRGVFSSQFYRFHKELAQVESLEQEEQARYQNLSSAFQALKDNPGFRREFRKFIRNVFLNLHEDGFLQLVDQVLDKERDRESIYQSLEKTIASAQPNVISGVYYSLKALISQRAVLKKQLQELLGEGFSANGYVEIGFPGRMVSTMQQVVDLSGKITVVNTQESLLDYIQSGFPRPYHMFVPLDEYAPLTSSLDRSSVDLISCFIGLHHCPEEKLDSYVQSISEVLRPGGSFILRDHDATSPMLIAMASLAHSTFNLGTGVPWQGAMDGHDEKNEERNFQSLTYWDSLMKRHGLMRSEDVSPLIRPGDPTMNSLVRYVKLPTRTNLFEDKYSVQEKRKQLQTFMTAVEWHSVRVARDYADFIEHTPFYLYPYFSQIHSFWSTFGDSWAESRRYHSRYEILTSDYFYMNLFIAGFHTAEFFIKGVISAPIAALYQSDANLELETIHLVVYDPDEEILAFGSEGAEVIRTIEAEPLLFEIKVPRYRKFRDIMFEMAKSNLQLVNIAGQKHIQVQCTVDSDLKNQCDSIAGCRVIGVQEMPNHPDQFIVYFNVEVMELLNVINELSLKGVSIDYVHDF